MKKILLFLLLHFLFNPNGEATHIRSGEITYTQIDATTIEATILTYTNVNSASADRDSLTICWGDGTCEKIARTNGPVGSSDVPNGEILDHDYKKNEYTRSHQYATLGNYTLSMSDPSRNSGILNILLADNFAFYIETEVFLSESLNHSPFNLQAPIDIGFVDVPFMHLLNTIDLNGDSISFQMVRPLFANGQPVTGYFDLTDISPGPSNKVNFNEKTGLLMWEAPQDAGEYNIAIEIKTYRDGVLNGRMIRDMLILVFEEENQRPLLTSPTVSFNEEVVPVEVGDTIRVSLEAEDLDVGQQINISSTSELYSYNSDPALFDVTYVNEQRGSALFTWVVKANELRDQAYQVVFKVQDNLGAASYLEVRYKVNSSLSTKTLDRENTKLKIFPNPSNSFLLVEGLEQEITNYTIWNRLGQVLQNGKIERNRQLDLRNIPTGFYYLQIEGKGGYPFVVE